MAALVKEGVAAGALGFSTSRTIAHRAITGEPVPGTFAAEDELFGIGRALGELGRGVFELAGAGAAGEDIAAPKAELDWMRRLSAEIGRPVTFAMLQVDAAPELWRELLALSADAVSEGAQIFPQVAGRPFGMLVGHQTTIHPFAACPTFDRAARAAVRGAHPPPARPRGAARDPRRGQPPATSMLLRGLHRTSRSAIRPTTSRARGVASRRSRSARAATPTELLYDRMLERDGRELFLVPVLNYSERQRRPDPRDDVPPARVARPRRRRRALRRDLRRVDPDLHAHALGARPQPRRANLPSSSR